MAIKEYYALAWETVARNVRRTYSAAASIGVGYEEDDETWLPYLVLDAKGEALYEYGEDYDSVEDGVEVEERRFALLEDTLILEGWTLYNLIDDYAAYAEIGDESVIKFDSPPGEKVVTGPELTL